MTAGVLEEATFEDLTRRHRRELHVHCYRMLASFDEAEDAVQEALLRAWRSRDSLTDAAGARPWLYRIATNVCLDLLRARRRRPEPARSFAEIPWIQPYPDRLLDEIAPSDDEPDAIAVARETIELAFIAALQLLPPRQRAALVLRDVLGQPAAETAALLETSVAAANSALQRARATLAEHLPARRMEWSRAGATAEERELLAGFIDAHERCDAAAAVAIASTDIRITMPPMPWLFDGIDAMAPLLERAFGPNREGDWRLLATAVNRMPAAGSYLRQPGDSLYRPMKLDVIRVEGGRIREVTTFGSAPFPLLGLPDWLE
ncbi:MAG TPA: RNA polymerase subunit sigma-70 [Actinomycetota bacterium]|nr:RNA polymerase subunit sigma-70 [Actinomycetota bacterium]